MNAGIFVLLLVLLAVYVGYPMVQNVPDQKRRMKGGSSAPVVKADSSKLLKEIEFDYELGNLSDEYRQEMISEAGCGSFAGVAVSTGRVNKEEPQDTENMDDRIEREVARLRGREIEVQVMREPDIESQVARLRTRPAASPVKCPSCGSAGTAADKFCGQCGLPLTRKSR
ncbi:MAG: zinc ribbon domain-containing protein [Dehalococcoidia bacterium]|nr:zinc ribbon domain-containing protein [Dehalococcoidia bacterium]